MRRKKTEVMKISIWRQFSSNNSSSYVIVGAFETPEKAHEAAEKFKALLRRIWEWYADHPDIRDAMLDEERYELTDAEREIMRDYPIEFSGAANWVASQKSLDFLPDSVAVFENLVFFASLDETVTDDTPFAQYMHQLGADVKFEEAMESYLTVRVSATAPDDATAQHIKTAAENYFMRDHTFERAPWALFYDGQVAPEALGIEIDSFIIGYRAWCDWLEDHRRQINDLRTRRITAQLANDEQAAAEISEAMKNLQAEQQYFIDDSNRHIHKIIWWTSIRADQHNKTVAVEGNCIQLPTLYFLPDDLGHGLPALVTWLRALGCTDVAYEFVPIPYKEAQESE